MKYNFYEILKTFLLGALVLLTFLFIRDFANRYEKFECEVWKIQALRFKNYYLTDWQKAQCEKHRVEILIP